MVTRSFAERRGSGWKTSGKLQIGVPLGTQFGLARAGGLWSDLRFQPQSAMRSLRLLEFGK
jgi:hypothetical protein